MAQRFGDAATKPYTGFSASVMQVPRCPSAHAPRRRQLAPLGVACVCCVTSASAASATSASAASATSATDGVPAPAPLRVADRAPRLSYALLVNPLGPISGALGTSLSDDVDSVYSFNLRFYQRMSPYVSMSLEPVFVAAQILDAQFYSTGLKWGPRVSWGGSGGKGFDGWYVTGLALLGGVWGSQASNPLTTAAFVGTGVEGGHAWQLDRFVVELGVGVQYSGYFAHESFDGSPMPGAGLKPLVNGSIGYAW